MLYEIPAADACSRRVPSLVVLFAPFVSLIADAVTTTAGRWAHLEAPRFIVDTLSGAEYSGDTVVQLITDPGVVDEFGTISDDSLHPDAADLLKEVRAGRTYILATTVEAMLTNTLRGASYRTVLMMLVKDGILRQVTIDEVHLFYESFRPALNNLGPLLGMILHGYAGGTVPPILMLTATCTPLMLKDVTTSIGVGQCVVAREALLRDGIRIVVSYYDKEATRITDVALHGIWQAHLSASVAGHTLDGRSGIVFVHTRSQAVSVCACINESGNLGGAVAHHSGMPMADRLEALAAWKRGHVFHLVATSGIIHGIDHDNVVYVVFASAPTDMLHAYQGVGRLLRHPRHAFAVAVFVCSMATLASIASASDLRRGTHGLQDTLAFFQNPGCRWEYLARKNGCTRSFTAQIPTCGNQCDNCDLDASDHPGRGFESTLFDVTLFARKFLELVMQGSFSSSQGVVPFGRAWVQLCELTADTALLGSPPELARIIMLELISRGAILCMGAEFAARPGAELAEPGAAQRSYLGLAVPSADGVYAQGGVAHDILHGATVAVVDTTVHCTGRAK